MWWSHQRDDEVLETCAELGSLADEAVARIHPEADEVHRLVDDLRKLAASLEARGDAPYDPPMRYREVVIMVGHETARQLRIVADGLREIRDALGR